MEPFRIGDAPWKVAEISASLDEFLRLYETRPIKDNAGGMKAPHMFAVWFITKRVKPDIIVESGIWAGQSTWLFEQTCPKSQIFSIDINLNRRKYISSKATYLNSDFSHHDWSMLTEDSLAFFDDHQDAPKRLEQCKKLKLRHLIFEDNYPLDQGDCCSLKQVFSGRNSRLLNEQDFKNIEVYREFPPIVKTSTTRWGDDWVSPIYPTEAPVLLENIPEKYQIFLDDAQSYTWLCYVLLKKGHL